MYQINDFVEVKSGDMKGLKGKIVEVDRMFRAIRANGEFEVDGFTTLESNIPTISIPYTFDGETLSVDFPETEFENFVENAYTQVSKFFDYAYTIESEGLNQRVLVAAFDLLPK